ncbi:hypothetical protein HMPREF1861_00305 [Corynebacterium kroppenstedtii]|nr:hypothetical protein HMPREF1861_00305 [Corynebacterium kroppenstedtii]
MREKSPLHTPANISLVTKAKQYGFYFTRMKRHTATSETRDNHAFSVGITSLPVE